MASILIIDDDPHICRMLGNMVERMDHQAAQSHNLFQGMKLVKQRHFDVVFLDVRLPDGNGLEAIPAIRSLDSKPEVIIMTGLGDQDGAELAIINGAWDYIEKPASLDGMRLPLIRALEYRREREAAKPPRVLKRQEIVGDSAIMRVCLDKVAQAAASQANVLICGDTGTGKELFARAIHANSRRAQKNFIVVDCAALPETLVESILFGHEKGSFTGADKRQSGLIEQAHGGTLFLDEVGELPLSTQRSFLRVLQEKRYRPLGAEEEKESDFRLIAATNRNLEEAVKGTLFREDLYFRLRSFSLELPPLKERLDDLTDLINFHLAKICLRYELPPKGYSPDLLEALRGHDWPGNVRELVGVLERTVASVSDEPVLYAYHLPTRLRVKLARASVRGPKEEETAAHNRSPGASPAWESHSPQPVPVGILDDGKRATLGMGPLRQRRNEAVAKAERRYLNELLEVTRGNIKESCGVSGLSRGRLYALMKKYDIRPSAHRR